MAHPARRDRPAPRKLVLMTPNPEREPLEDDSPSHPTLSLLVQADGHCDISILLTTTASGVRLTLSTSSAAGLGALGPVTRSENDDRDVAHVLAFPPFRLDVTNETLWRGDTKLYLRAKPFTILRYLAEHPKRLVTQGELTERAWGTAIRSDSLLRTHIRELRQLLGRGIIETVTGRGYNFTVDVTHVVERSPSPRRPPVRAVD